MENDSAARPGQVPGAAAFEKVPVKEVVPMIDAITMGGNRACRITLANPDLFSCIGMFVKKPA
jgi:hypothetical protein